MNTASAIDVDQRPITFLTVHDIDGWKIKTYRTTPLAGELLTAARRRAADTLPPRPDRVGAFGVGFLIVHQTTTPQPPAFASRPTIPPPAFASRPTIPPPAFASRPIACFALVDWWVREDQLHQRVFAAPPDRPAGFEPLLAPVVGCVPALGVIDHERQAWLRHVLANPAGPDIDGYLADTFPGVN